MATKMEQVADHLKTFNYNGRRWQWEWMYPGLFDWHFRGGHSEILGRGHYLPPGTLTAEFSGPELVFQFADLDGVVIGTHVVDFAEFMPEPPKHLADYVMGAAKAVAGDLMRGERRV